MQTSLKWRLGPEWCQIKCLETGLSSAAILNYCLFPAWLNFLWQWGGLKLDSYSKHSQHANALAHANIWQNRSWKQTCDWTVYGRRKRIAVVIWSNNSAYSLNVETCLSCYSSNKPVHWFMMINFFRPKYLTQIKGYVDLTETWLVWRLSKFLTQQSHTGWLCLFIARFRNLWFSLLRI